jgi:hypothetical protein
MTDAPAIIWVAPRIDHKGKDWDSGDWDATRETNFNPEHTVQYIRYDKHVDYLADTRAAFTESCEQIDEYKEKSAISRARITELEVALDSLRGRYRVYAGWPDLAWAGHTDVALLKMADKALGTDYD